MSINKTQVEKIHCSYISMFPSNRAMSIAWILWFLKSDLSLRPNQDCNREPNYGSICEFSISLVEMLDNVQNFTFEQKLSNTYALNLTNSLRRL